MSYYSKISFNQSDLNRTYRVTAASGRIYEFDTQTANVIVDEEDKLLIFTTKDNYRIALNCSQIESLAYDKNAN
ncbi:hypothetical protein IKP85_06935 [bacterium]|nr:hypothetical protein [bacterium]